MGKPTKTGKISTASKLNKATTAAQRATPFVKEAIEKGGVEYASWLSQGLYVTDDFETKSLCPFCGKSLLPDVDKYEALRMMKVTDLKPLFSFTTLFEQLDIDPRQLETEDGAEAVRKRLLLLCKVSDEIGKIIAFCNAPKSSLMEKGVPVLEVDECVYEVFPELREPVSAIVSKTEDIKMLFGQMKRAFNSLIKAKCGKLNRWLKRLSIPYQFTVMSATRGEKTTALHFWGAQPPRHPRVRALSPPRG